MHRLRILGEKGSTPLALTAEDCAAMPESAQVADVSTLVPGRSGRAVRLAALLERLGASPRSRYLHVASRDPGFAVSLAIDEAQDALVVYTVPEAKGGPFRLLVPGHKDECVNVKELASLELSDRPGRDTRPQDDAEHEALHRKCKSP